MRWLRSHGKFPPRGNFLPFFPHFLFLLPPPILYKFPHVNFDTNLFFKKQPLFFRTGMMLITKMVRVFQSILCGDLAIKRIDQPFVSDAEDKSEWAI